MTITHVQYKVGLFVFSLTRLLTFAAHPKTKSVLVFCVTQISNSLLFIFPAIAERLDGVDKLVSDMLGN